MLRLRWGLHSDEREWEGMRFAYPFLSLPLTQVRPSLLYTACLLVEQNSPA